MVSRTPGKSSKVDLNRTWG